MLDLFQRIHTPRTDTTADLHLASTAKLELFQLALDKVGRREEEGDLASVVLSSQLGSVTLVFPDSYKYPTDLGAEKQVPSLDKVPAKISGRLANKLNTDIVPLMSAFQALHCHCSNASC
jgi:hypothetical protein